VFLIYFDTATFDQIQKDTKMKMGTIVGVIGGTLGLFTGFSILSGVEILYYLGKIFFLAITRKVRMCVYRRFLIDLLQHKVTKPEKRNCAVQEVVREAW
jgi:hypothetical protein